MTTPEAIPRASGVYKIVNRVREKLYVGSAKNLYQRRHAHLSNLRAGKHHSLKLQNSWNKYGADAFDFIVLELTDASSLMEREQFWINKLSSVEKGYNILPNAGSRSGAPLSTETKIKISMAHKGKKLSRAHREAISKGAVRDRVRSLEETERRAMAATGKKHTKAARDKIREKAIGRVVSPATRAKMSAARKGRKQSEALKRSLALAHDGAKRTEEAKANMSAAQKRIFNTNPPSRDDNGRFT